MKKAKKFLAILFSLIILIVVIIVFIKLSKNNSTNNENTNFVKEVIGLNSIGNSSNTINQNGENTGIYVGSQSNFHLITIKINKDESKEKQATSLIESISNSIGYKITIYSIQFEDNKIKIDFEESSTPFKISENYTGNNLELYKIYGDTTVASTIFDSIYKTFKSYFGNDFDIYFSINNRSIESSDLPDGYTSTIPNMNSPYTLTEE